MYLSFISSKKIPNIFLLLIVVVLFCVPCKADAMNWEGHDDWMTDEDHARTLIYSLPHVKPLARAYPLCREREEKHARNPYEQRPIIGVNCVDKRDDHDSSPE